MDIHVPEACIICKPPLDRDDELLLCQSPVWRPQNGIEHDCTLRMRWRLFWVVCIF